MKNEIQKHEVRNPYTARLRVPYVGSGKPTRTKQQFKDECDINNIMRRYANTGIIDHLNRYQGRYADLANAVDYQTAQNIILEGNKAFSSLPSKIRERFHNSPAEFLAFVQEPKNRAEMRELGLLKPDTKPTEAQAEEPKAIKKKPDKPVKQQVEEFDPSD